MTGMNELRVDRKLLENDFEGYKLSLTPVPVYKEELADDVDVVRPSDDQYSFLHHREFTLHNHLYGDLWNKDIVYFIDSKRRIKRSWMNELERLEKTVAVWEIPEKVKRKPGHYNFSLHFASPNIAVVSDGAGTLYVLETSSRADIIPWKVLHSDEVLGEEVPFKIVDARCVDESPNRVVHCIILHINPRSNQSTENGHDQENNRSVDGDKSRGKFETILNWVTLTEEITGYWSKKSVNTIKGQGTLDYIALEPECKGLYIISDSAIGGTQDSDKEKENGSDEKMDCDEEKEQNTEPPAPDYHWQQTFKDIKIWFEVPSETKKSDLKVISKKDEVSIIFKDNVFLHGKLHQHIDADLTTWSLNCQKFEIVLQKLSEGTMWTKLMDSNKIGKEVMDEETVANIHNKLSHLCSDKEESGGSTVMNSGQLEECDTSECESRNLVRLEADTLKLTHKVIVGSQQWLLKTHIYPDKVPSFCVRHDVDGCVWQPSQPSENSASWECEHIGTFLAFGYIQASKQNKKFTSAPPDLSYITIVDVSGHVILYRKGIAVCGELRNRKTGRKLKEVAMQNLINLQTNSEILGAYSSDKYFFVLTKNSLHILHIC